MDRPLSRRGTLSLVALSLAGCVGASDPSATTDPENVTNGATNSSMTATPNPGAIEGTDIPIAAEQLPVEFDLETLQEHVVSGGVPKDGIPPIDDPQFESVAAVGDRIDDGDPVFGIVNDGEARAYPQNILVYHEIVNDEIGGDAIAVTYCPLTGTAMGFERGPIEFGVSGTLLNSNLVMYDREADSRWPQILGTAIAGPLQAASLREIPVYWSTWQHWRNAFPDSLVLTEDTGFARNYNNDPYGDYNPVDGYYDEQEPPIFQPLQSDDRFPPKRMFFCARPQSGPLAIERTHLANNGLVDIERSDADYLAVFERSIDAGICYRVEDASKFSYDESENVVVTSDGDAYDPSEIPEQRVYAFDAMWFSWAGFYPATSVYATETESE